MRGTKWERIIRVLLNDPDGSLTKYRVSKLAGSSIGWTMEYLKKLESEGYIKGTRVVKFEELVEYWADNANRPKVMKFHVRSPRDVLKDIGFDYALTTYLADNAYIHYLFPSRWDLYIDRADISRWKETLTKHGLVGAGNMRLLLHDEHAMYGKLKLDGLWIASQPQVMVDLKLEGGVCGEAYEILVNEYVSRL
jgi:hypothetical protein